MSSSEFVNSVASKKEESVMNDATSRNAIYINNISKCYEIYEKPHDRLRQFVLPKLQGLVGKTPKKYFQEFWALNELTFEVAKGETVGVIGRNGSGKSTLLQLICGTLSPTTGSVETHGRIAALLELGSGFNPEFTGLENVHLNAALLGLNSEEINERYDDIVAFADIGEFIDQPVKCYSSGMIVKLAFAVSVFVDPEILIVDEALAVGDAVFQYKCLERLKDLTMSGSTLLFVSHDMQMVKSFCDHAIYLDKGILKLKGRTEDVTEHYIMDVRDQQKSQSLKTRTGVYKKSFAGYGDGIAYGTSEGKIINTYFVGLQEDVAAYTDSDVVRFAVELEYRNDVECPSLTVILQNSKLMAIGGNTFPLMFQDNPSGLCKGRVTFELPMSLGPGDYFLTTRLESRKNDSEFYPVDKQVGVLSFSVSLKERNFLGSVNLGLRMVDKQQL